MGEGTRGGQELEGTESVESPKSREPKRDTGASTAGGKLRDNRVLEQAPALKDPKVWVTGSRDP